MAHQSLNFLVSNAFDVGGILRNVCDGRSSVEGGFNDFAKEATALGSVGSTILPNLLDTHIGPSPELSRILSRIVNDNTTIFAHLRELIQELNSRCSKVRSAAARNSLLRTARHHDTKVNEVLNIFLHRQIVHLYRSQIVYATHTLNIVAVVLQYAKQRPNPNPDQLDTRNESHLLGEQRSARSKIEELEPLFPGGPPIRATLWLQPLPRPTTTNPSVFEVLVQVWSHSLRPATAQSHSDPILMRQVNQMAAHMEKQDRKLSALERYYTNAEKSREEDQRKIHSLEEYAARQEKQSREDHDLIEHLKAQLEEQHDQWTRRHEQQERKAIRLSARFAELVKAYNEQSHGVERIKADLHTLKVENNKLTAENHKLHKDNDKLAVNNAGLQNQLDRAIEAAEDVQDSHERLKQGFEQVQSSRDSWRSRAEVLEGELAALKRERRGTQSRRPGEADRTQSEILQANAQEADRKRVHSTTRSRSRKSDSEHPRLQQPGCAPTAWRGQIDPEPTTSRRNSRSSRGSTDTYVATDSRESSRERGYDSGILGKIFAKRTGSSSHQQDGPRVTSYGRSVTRGSLVQPALYTTA